MARASLKNAGFTLRSGFRFSGLAGVLLLGSWPDPSVVAADGVSQDPLIVRAAAASDQRRNEAIRTVDALQQKERDLELKTTALGQKLREMAEKAGYSKDAEVAALTIRIREARERRQKLDTDIRRAKPAPFAGLEQMLEGDRAEDQRRADQEELRKMVLQIPAMEQRLNRRFCELLAARPEAAVTVDDWEKNIARAAAMKRDVVRAQAARASVASGENAHMQQVRDSMAPLPPDMPSVEIPPPADAEQRRERFRARNTPESVRQLGEQFFAQMTLDGPGLEEVAKLVESGQYGPALEAYKKVFFARLSGQPDGAGSAPEDGEDAGQDDAKDGEAVSVTKYPVPVSGEKVQKALDGFFVGTMKEAKAPGRPVQVKLGPPGEIHWVFAENEGDWKLDFCRELGNPLELGSALRKSYVAGGPREHLLRWSEIMDDWAMNWQQDVEKSPLPVRNYYLLTVCRIQALRAVLAAHARARPSFVGDMPATTLARLLMVVNQEYLSSAIRLGRCGLYNLRIMALNSMIPVALEMPEFRAQQWALREAWRQADNNFVYKIRRDGANFEFANEGHEDTDQSMLANMEKMRAWRAQPAWLEPYWDQEFQDNFLMNTRYRISNLKQDGYCYRLSTRIQTARFSGEKPLYKVDLLKDEEEVGRRLWSVFGIGRPREEPQIQSEALPFQGYYYLRGGWKPDDYFLYFQSIGQPVLSGREDNTGFMFYNHGHSQLLAPPPTVDGRVQNIHYGCNEKSGGKSYYAGYGLPDAIKPFRFLGGKDFDFCEGAFEGVYQYARPSAFFYTFGVYDWLAARGKAEERAKREGVDYVDEPVRDVRQGRQILAVKGRNVFVVTDTLHSELPHRYTQNYTVYTPVRNRSLKERLQLLQEKGVRQLEVDGKKQMLRTRNLGLPNLEMAHFSSFPIGYTLSKDMIGDVLGQLAKGGPVKGPIKGLTKRESQETAIHQAVQLNQKVAASWEGKGTQVLVTLVATAPASYGSQVPEILRDIRSMDLDGEAAGFTARFSDGTPISYIARSKPAFLRIGELTATASTLLLAGDRGVVLDCAAIAGRPPAVPDFSFHMETGKVVVDEPILRPIQPVAIDPVVNVFTGVAKVTLRCPTPGVEIRYTLDGSRPVPQSNLYATPFEVKQTCRLKVRAFRAGVTRDVWQQDGTWATVVYSTVLRRELPLPPAPAAATGTKPGLGYEYFEGPWTTLMARSLDVPAQKTGVVAKLLDVSPRRTAGAFGIRYAGFLTVPSDGVYTFHCPREYTFPDVDSGYDLRVFVDDREWNPAVRWQGHGTWSVALQKGRHRFQVAYVDARSNPRKIEFVWGFPDPSYTWSGTAPELLLSGPGIPPAVIPASMLSTD